MHHACACIQMAHQRVDPCANEVFLLPTQTPYPPPAAWLPPVAHCGCVCSFITASELESLSSRMSPVAGSKRRSSPPRPPPAARCSSSQEHNSCTNSIDEGFLRSYVPVNKDCVKPIKGVKGSNERFE